MGKASDDRLEQLARYLVRNTGLHFPAPKLGDLERNILAAAKDFGFKDIDVCIDWLLSSSLTRSRMDVLTRHLTIGETYFFREKQSLDVFSKSILGEVRERHAGDRCLRIWSAGCASGEEPYSIAIMLKETMPDLADWHITILATDLNANFLEKALRGIYSKWSFRQCPPAIRGKYFTAVDKGSFEIKPEIKKMVNFGYLNLASDVFPSVWNNTDAMDVIFCRNVLMYFASDVVERVLGNFHRGLVDGGYLIVSPSETSPVFRPRFSPSRFARGLSVYRKSGVASTAGDEVMEVCKISPQPTMALPEAAVVGPSQVVPAGVESAPEMPVSKEIIVESVEIKQDNAVDMLRLARTCANHGHLAEAAQWCRKAIAVNKLDPDAYYLLGSVLLEQGQIEEAIMCFKRVLYLDPDFVLAHFALGNLTLRLGRTGEAARHFTNTLVLLRKCQPGDILPGSEGITAGQLTDTVHAHVKEPA
jgi:chemotaxis protein methyltransferase CheR